MHFVFVGRRVPHVVGTLAAAMRGIARSCCSTARPWFGVENGLMFAMP
jgi:hypothetical protein